MRYKLFTISWPVLLLAFMMALALWYAVAVRDRLDVQVEVRIDYRGIPENLIVTDGLINKMVVRFRGPEALVRNLSPQSLAHVIDLSTIRKGKNTLPMVPSAWSRSFRAFEVLEIIPPRLNIMADTVQEHSLSIIPTLTSPLQNTALDIREVQISPPTVQVRGPEGTINTMRNIPLAIKLDPNAPPGTYEQHLTLDVPILVTATPSTVKVSYTVASNRKSVEMERSIEVDAPDKRSYRVSPSTLRIQAEVPEALAKSSSYLQKARFSVAPPPLEVDQSLNVPLRWDLPDGMTLVGTPPVEVTVTKVKK